MKCTVCEIPIESTENLFNDDWVFCFFEGDEEHGPVCPSCSSKLLYLAQDGVYELKEEYRGKIIYNDQLERIEEEPMGDVILGFILN